jgi:hypothetical protein
VRFILKQWRVELGTIIALIVFLAVSVAVSVLLSRYARKSLLLEVQGVLNTMSQDIEGKLETLAELQSNAIKKVLEGQTAVNKDHKSKIEELARLTGAHNEILKFDTGVFTGAPMPGVEKPLDGSAE